MNDSGSGWAAGIIVTLVLGYFGGILLAAIPLTIFLLWGLFVFVTDKIESRAIERRQRVKSITGAILRDHSSEL